MAAQLHFEILVSRCCVNVILRIKYIIQKTLSTYGGWCQGRKVSITQSQDHRNVEILIHLKIDVGQETRIMRGLALGERRPPVAF